MFSKNFVFILMLSITKITQSVPFSNNNYEDENSTLNTLDEDDENNSEREKPIVETNADMEEFKKHLNSFLQWYYRQHENETKVLGNEINSKINDDSRFDQDVMQSDQPMPSNSPQTIDSTPPFILNLSTNSTRKNPTDLIYNDFMRYRRDSDVVEDRSRDSRLMEIKHKILQETGRDNSTSNGPHVPPEFNIGSINISQLIPRFQFGNKSMSDEDFLTEKIRSYYPSCEIPRNTDQDVWKDENTMNLYFNIDHEPDDSRVSVATATLRLYRLPQENLTASSDPSDTSCENSSNDQEDKLLRITIYWYTRALKRHRVKRRLSDSKVVADNAKWVELSVKPATRAWSKGRNLGLLVSVEDQDGLALKADRYFKGASCMVGASTPKPIPTVIIDAARWASEFQRANGSAGANTTTAMHNYVSLLPTIDICTVESRQNFSFKLLTNQRISSCNLKKVQDQTQKALQRERFEKLAALASYLPPPVPHIRHQNKHHQDVDSESRITSIGHTIVMTHDELKNYNAQLANNATNINR